MIWSKLESPEQLRAIKEASHTNTILIFKHSTSCSISRTALSRLERNWIVEQTARVKPFFLDLLKYRNVSDQIAAEFSVQHESPQILLIENGESVYDRSHFDIDYLDVVEALGRRAKN